MAISIEQLVKILIVVLVVVVVISGMYFAYVNFIKPSTDNLVSPVTDIALSLIKNG